MLPVIGHVIVGLICTLFAILCYYAKDFSGLAVNAFCVLINCLGAYLHLKRWMKKRRLDRQLRQASDRRDWDACEQLESDLNRM